MSRSRSVLLAENALLRQQLIVLNRQVKRPALTTGDRVRLGLLARCTHYWRSALLTPSSPTGLGCPARHTPALASRAIPPLLAAQIAVRTGWAAYRVQSHPTVSANAFCERFIGSLRRECLDHMLVLSPDQWLRIVAAYIDYPVQDTGLRYNRSRPHQGIEQRLPAFFHYAPELSAGKVTSVPILGGLHHSYTRAAYLH